MKTKTVKKYLFLTLIAVLCAACVAVGCLFMGGGTPSVGAATQEHDAAFGNTHEEKGKQLPAAGGELAEGAYYLTGNITLTTEDITIPEGAKVDLCLNGYKLTGTGNGPVITVEKNAIFNLHDCNGSNGSHDYHVNEHGKYEFEGTVTGTITSGVITGGTGKVDGNNTYGGGIFLAGSNAVFTMYGGAIAGNMAKRDLTETGYSTNDATYGGGVYVGSGKTFNMHGGTIEGNTAGSSSGTNDETGGYNNDHDRGGGVAVNGGTFNMYGGAIKNNAADDGAGIYVDVDVDGSGFEMYDAEVSNNFARHNGGGIYINNGTAVIGDTNAVGTMSAGIIKDNRANSFGGGIYVNRGESSELQLKSGFVTGNSAMTGGGIYVHSGGSGDEANSGSLVLGGDSCTVTIKGNSAIYYSDRPTEAMNGYGGGVFMRNAGVPSNIDMSGKIIITDNDSKPNGKDDAGSDNLYLEDGIAINAHDAADDVDGSSDADLLINPDSQIGITLAARGDNYFDENTFIVNGFGSDVTVDELKKIFSSDVGGELNVVVENGKITVGSFNYSIPVDSTYTEARNGYTVAIEGTTPDDAQAGKGTTYDSGTFKIESRTPNITFTVTAPQKDDYLSVIINGGWGRNLNENKEDAPPTAYIYNFATFSDEYDGAIFGYTPNGATVSVTIPYKLYASSLVSAEAEAEKGIHIAYIGAEASVTIDGDITYYYTIEQAFEAASGTATITLLKNADTANTLKVIRDVTLDLSGHALSMASGAQGSVISVDAGAKFTLKDSDCTATNTDHTHHTHSITVGEDTVSISGGLITGGSAERGGGVYTDGGNVTMSGGTIAGNTATGREGGGVYVNNGSFTMSGGTISNNTATRNGGGVCVEDGTFTMQAAADGTAPTISGNSAGNRGGGVYVDHTQSTMSGGEISGNKESTTSGYGGGVYVYSGTFTMSSGTISGNSAQNGGGVYLYGRNAQFTMEGGTISNNKASGSGGGVYVLSGTFKMSGTAKISGNEATTSGGGVYVYSGATFEMTGTAAISNNTATDGGGVYVYSGTFIMSGTAEISANSATSGGGVYVMDSFKMTGGTISGNTARQDGGGVYVGGTFTMSGGEISGNNSDYNGGGGVYVAGSATFTMSGGEISGNNSDYNGGGVYVYSGTFEMTGGTIGGDQTADANSAGNGGGVYVDIGARFEMSGTAAISNNSANSGGGVNVNSGTFEMSGTATISNNTARRGGGVYVYDATFTMTGGTIGGSADADANKATAYGGGVYVGTNAKFEMSGTAKISGNEATTSGGGVYVAGGKINLSGSPTILDNTVGGAANNLYLSSGIVINSDSRSRSNTLNGGEIGVTLADSYTDTIFAYTKSGNDATEYFSSDAGGVVELTSTDDANGYKLYYKVEVTVSGGPDDLTGVFGGLSEDSDGYYFKLYHGNDDGTFTVTAPKGYDVSSVTIFGNTATADSGSYTVSHNDYLTASERSITVAFENKQIDSITWYWSQNGSERKEITDALPYNGTAYTITAVGYTSDDAKVPLDVSQGEILNAGTYALTASLPQGSSYQFAAGVNNTLSLTISPKELTLDMVSGINSSYTYTGSAIEPEVTVNHGDKELVSDTDYTVSYGTNTTVADGGTVTITGKGNYSGTVTKTFTISKADYDMTGISFENITVTYDGKEHKPAISGTLPTGADGIQVTVNYSVGATNVSQGAVTVTATFATTSGNYNVPESMTATVTITAKEVTLAWTAPANLEYDGTSKVPTVVAEGLVEGDNCAVSAVLTTGADNVNVGTFTYTATGLSNANYKLPANVVSPEYTITAAEYDTSNLKFEGATVEYDGNKHSIVVTGLPKDVTVSYEGNGKIDAGTYTVTAKFTVDGNHAPIADMTATLKITAKEVTLVWTAPANLEYDGAAKVPTVVAEGLVEGDNCTVSAALTGGADNVNVGTFTYTATGLSNANYKLPANVVSPEYTITAAEYDTSNLKFEGATVEYDGNKHSIVVTGLPKDVTVSYEGNGKIDAGTYTVTAKFTVDGNHAPIADMTATLKITAKEVTLVWTAPANLEYDGAAKVPTVVAEGLVEGDNCAVSAVLTTGADNVNVGTFTYTATGLSNANYKLPANVVSPEYTISAAEYDTSNLKFEGATVTYDGNKHSIEVTGLPEGVTVSYKGNGKIDAGTYTVTAKFTVDGNHAPIADMQATLEIEQRDISNVTLEVTGSYTYNGSEQEATFTVSDGDIAITADDYKVSYSNNVNAGTAGITLTATSDGNYKGSISADFEIAKVQLTVSGTTATDREFDGTTEVNVTLGTVNGIVEGDNVTVNVSGTVVDADAGTGKKVTLTYKLSGEDAGNYIAPVEGTCTVDISAKEISAEWSYSADGVSATVISGNTSVAFGKTYTVSVTAKGVNNESVALIIGGQSGNSAVLSALGDHALAASISPANGNYILTNAQVTFSIITATSGYGSLEIGGNPSSVTYGDSVSVTYKYSGDVEGYTITYKSSDESVATVDGNGSVTLKKAGVFTITAIWQCTGYADLTATTGNITVNAKQVSAVWSVEGESGSSVTYDGDVYTISASIESGSAVGTDDLSDALTISGQTSGQNVGSYTATASLKEEYSDRYVLNGETASFTLTIKQAANSWKAELSIVGWTYGETANTPAAEAEFGEVTFTYSDAQDGTYTSAVPKAAGSWYVKASVSGTDNYTGLEAIVTFTIAKAKPVIPELPDLGDDEITYGEPVGDITLPGDWEWADPEDKPTVADGEDGIEVTIPVDDDNYDWTDIPGYDPEDGTYTDKVVVTVNPATPDEGEIAAQGSHVYGVTLDEISLTASGFTGLAAGAQPEWVNGATVPTVTNDGYAAKIAVDDDNYDWTGIEGYADGYYTATVKVTITADKYDTSNLKFEGATVEYDGNKHSIEVTGLPEGVTVSYEGNGKIDAGTYTVTAKFTVDGNHAPIADMQATLEISQREITVTIDSKTSVYGEATQTLTASVTSGSIVAGDENVYSLSCAVTNVSPVDEYDITGTCNNDNYNITFVDGVYTITAAEYDTSDLKFEGATVTYDGKEHSIEVTGLPEGVTVSYEGNGQVDAGTYTVTAKFTVDDNHVSIADMQATLEIEQRDISNVTLTIYGSYQYTGKPVQPAWTISDSAVITENDYAMALVNNTYAGVATLIVTGTRNYCGSASVTFDILKAAPVVGTIAAQGSHVYGVTLGEISLTASGFTGLAAGAQPEWVNGTTVPTVTNDGYKVQIAVDDDNYDWTNIAGYENGYYTATVYADIQKAPVTELPQPPVIKDELEEGEEVGNIELPEGWEWVDPEDTPTVEEGEEGIEVKIPVDDDNYDWTDIEGYDPEDGTYTDKVQVPVKEPQPEYGVIDIDLPATGAQSYEYGTSLKDIALVAGSLQGAAQGAEWEWAEESPSSVYPGVENAGYDVKIAVDTTNYDWTDVAGYADGYYTVHVNVSIYARDIAVSWSGTSFTYNGEARQPLAEVGAEQLVGNDKLQFAYTIAGEKVTDGKAINAGSYTVTASIDDANYTIASGSECAFTIARAVVEIPSSGGEIESNGEEQEFFPEGFDGDIMDIEGNRVTEGGDYDAEISLKDPDNYEWSDGTTDSKQIGFTVLGDEYIDLLWLIILLIVLIVIELILLIMIIRRRKGMDDGADAKGGSSRTESMMAGAPMALLAVKVIPWQIATIAVLAVIFVALAIADIVLFVAARRAEKESGLDDIVDENDIQG